MGLEFGKHGIEGTRKEKDEQITAQTEAERIKEDGEESKRILDAMEADGLSDFERTLQENTKNAYEVLSDDISEEEEKKIIEENDKAINESIESAKKMQEFIAGLFD